MLHVQRVATLGADDSNLNETLFGNEILRLFTPTAAVSPSFLDKFCKFFVNLFSSSLRYVNCRNFANQLNIIILLDAVVLLF